MASNRTIGAKNTIPWHIPEELQVFKRTTLGHAVIMGRKTYDSIGFALPGRKNIILTRKADFSQKDCITASSIDQAITLCHGQKKVFILGGEEIFKQTMDICHTILLTVLDRPVEGDTYFPHFSETDFIEQKRERYSKNEPFTIFTFKRIGQ